jgi:uncharacterized phage protein (TIGR01671 family)
MTREIKFRAWDKDKKCMIYGSFLWYLTFDGRVLRTDLSEAKNIELMQFTGLKDKNGAEIYEGDLLKKKDAEKPRVVKWTDQNGAYFVLSNSIDKKVDWDDCLTDEQIKIYGYEIIGNIYENPELLTK